MNETTFLDRSKNPYVISNTPSGKPTTKADSRAEFVAECVEAIELNDVEKMTELLARCKGFPIMRRKLMEALK